MRNLTFASERVYSCDESTLSDNEISATTFDTDIDGLYYATERHDGEDHVLVQIWNASSNEVG